MAGDENFKEYFDYSFLKDGKSFGRVDFYSSTSQRSRLVLSEVPGSRFCGEDRPEYVCDDTDREEFKEPFDYSFLNND